MCSMRRCVLVVLSAAALQPCSRLPARLPPRPAGNRRAETGEATRRQARVAQQVRSELAVLIRDGATRVKSTARTAMKTSAATRRDASRVGVSAHILKRWHIGFSIQMISAWIR